MIWNGDKVIQELKRLQIRNLRRAAIHLSRKIKENLSVAGRQTGVEEREIKPSRIIRTGRDERGRRLVTVTQTEFHRIADPIHAAQRTKVRRAIRRSRRGKKP